MEEQKIFSTRDLSLASTLTTLNFPLLGIDYQIEGEKNLPIGYFKFDDVPELQTVREKYLQGKLVVEPRAFVANMRSLKGEVTNAYKNPHNIIN
jgi:hypothetical protein